MHIKVIVEFNVIVRKLRRALRHYEKVAVPFISEPPMRSCQFILGSQDGTKQAAGVILKLWSVCYFRWNPVDLAVSC